MDAGPTLPVTGPPARVAAPEEVARPGAGTGIRRVLVALDEHPPSVRALGVALEIAAGCRAEVALVHVIDPRLLVTPDGGIGPDTLRAEYERRGHVLLEAAAERVTTHGAPRAQDQVAQHAGEPLRAWQFLEFGRPAHEVVRVADEWIADLIVVGSRGGRSAVARALLGSTAEGVLSHSLRPVVVVPAPT